MATGSDPVAIHGLEPLVSRPRPRGISLHPGSTDASVGPVPIWEWTSTVGPYDPASRRLYIWAFDRNGWIEVLEAAGTWVFGERGIIEPKLYFPADDIEDVTAIARSALLGVQFYSGFTAPHWLTGGQSYRVYRISGTEMSRVPELEAGRLQYLGDDLVAGLAVFAPAHAPWSRNPEVLVWYDGTGIVPPPADLSPPTGWCG